MFNRQSTLHHPLPHKLMAQIRNFGRKSQYTNETNSQLNGGDESYRNPFGTLSQIFKKERGTEVVIMDENNR
jgi:hypothetical protein